MNTIDCTNCKTVNSVLNPKCKKCGSFLQRRVPNLNLSETMWEIIEKPKDTFFKICLSEQKNYVFLMFAIFGIGLIFTSFWYSGAGGHYANLLNLLVHGLAFGPFIGVIVFYIFTYLAFMISSKIFKTETTLRNIRAVTAYSLVPVVFATIFILPTELIVFGLYFFTINPSPYMFKPEAYIALMSLDCLSVLYSMILFYVGITISNNIGKIKALVLTLILIFVFLCLTIVPMEIVEVLIR
jgi:hypothetical protein